MKNIFTKNHGYSLGCIKAFALVIIIILVLFATDSFAQLAQQQPTFASIDNLEAASDSTKLFEVQTQKQKVIEFIVQKQSDMYEGSESLKDAYNKLSQMNIAIQLYEEKLKLHEQIKKEKM